MEISIDDLDGRSPGHGYYRGERMKRPDERKIGEYWTERPMIHPGYGFDVENATPEEIFAHAERIMRDKGRLHQEPDAPLLSRYIDYVSLEGKTALEIGYGVGWLTAELAKAGATVHGIDLSRSHYEYSRYRFRDDPNVQLRVGSAEDMPYGDDTCDFVCAWGVIDHAADDQRCYDEIWRVLKPGGKAFLMVYRRGGPKLWWQKIVRKGLLRGELLQHGFNIKRFIYSVTDAYQEDSPGAPISRHYTRRQLLRKLQKFEDVELMISGNENEWKNLPFERLPLSNLLGERILHRLVEISGAYWLVHMAKPG